MSKWVSTGDYGIRYREHPTKTTGVGRSKRPLRYYTAVYKWQKKIVTDVYGWEGVDFQSYDNLIETAVLLRQNRKHLTPPFTLKELHEEMEYDLQAKEAAKQAELDAEKAEKALILDNIFSEYCVARYDKKTLKDDQGYYRNWIKPDIGHKRLDQIVTLDLERIRKKMVGKNRAPQSIHHVKKIVRQLYNFANERGLYSGPFPTTHFLKKQKLDNRRQRYLSPQEAETLLEEIHKHSESTYRISLLSLNSGLRFGEIAALKWQHVSTDRREIVVIDPKNAETRTVYMSETVLAMFNGMAKGKPAELVFPSQQGSKMASISKTFSRAVSTLGFNDGIDDRRMQVVFHTLRHSCASWLVNSGVELPIIAKILGHKSLQMTMRYSHVNDASVKGAMRTLDQQQQEQEPKVANIREK